MTTPYSIALHGGAGTIARGQRGEAAYHEALQRALAAGRALLEDGAAALDAVVATVVALENEPLFNAGQGAVLNADGAHELDAGVMDGASRAAGAVAAVRRIRNPVLAAREVLRGGRCVLLVGEGAERLARERGLELVDNAFFATAHRRAQWEVARAGQPGAAPLLDHDGRMLAEGGSRLGTVGAVARDRQGHLAAATSTGGMTNKAAGRVGDSPIVGAGVFADDRSCALSATGTGEHFIRACLAHDVHARMLYGAAPLERAAREAIEQSLQPLGGVGGLVAIDREGRIAMPYNSAGMYRAWARQGEAARTAIFGIDEAAAG
ncbi:MAG: isoaspartyl peptidase/L-asparaginase [Burkholderiales bacterium]|nr:isoaspartyl peptidase/L-asparaginase [Burkholderiales bacterium]MDE2396114.1 isoaspartyl peptidase/L-asparaginase [Burkholderiales bacterium]